MRNSGVLVIGAGGLGSPVIQYLAAAGIGRLGIVDYDVVEVNNLHRQVIHNETKVGIPKAVSAQQAAAAINRHIALKVYNTTLSSSNALDIFRRFLAVLTVVMILLWTVLTMYLRGIWLMMLVCC